ncbi:hypothetical protein [Sphingomonas sp. VNH70]|uniref:hypothetical protein n=1 Tax=Sphingomonas silueang TaxID=3156617 RepID=UPI0032B5F162
MRLFLALILSVMPCAAVAQMQPAGADRHFPAPFAAILRKLTKAQADKMQASANEYCKRLDYAAIPDLYTDISHCTLMQSTAIASVDTALFSLDDDTPTKYRPKQIKKCWAIYKALGSGDAENLDNCFADLQYFELLQRVAGPESEPAPSTPSNYCDRVAQAAGGSYMILEECVKQENASRRRLGR